MRLLRIGPRGQERPAVWLDDVTYLDVSDAIEDFDEDFFGRGGLGSLRPW